MKRKLRKQKRAGRSPASGDEQPKEETARAGLESIDLNALVVAYVQVVVSLIEERRVEREEILEMLRRAMRQRSLARERRIDYVVRTLREDPP